MHAEGGSMANIETFSALIGDIYDASLDPGLWQDVFDEVCAYVGVIEAGVILQDNIRKIAEVPFGSTHDPHYRQLYAEKYFRINPMFPTITFFNVETTIPVTDILSRAELCQTKFGREWLAPQRYIDSVFSIVEKSATGCALLTAIRDANQGFFDDEVRRRFTLIVPHVRRALLIGKVIDLKRVEAAALADSLDTLASGMFLVDETGRIVHANASAHMMVAEANVLRAADGRLHTVTPETDRTLLDTFTAAANGDGAVGRKGIAVPLDARDGSRYVANVMPLTGGARRNAGVSYAAVAVVFVHKAVLDLPSPPEAMAKTFQLTPAELRVLFAIVEVGGVPEVADVLGITEGTVKTHLHHLFEKTGTTRQVDLVKLVAGYSNALLR
jgi:DNA-binding CsgD family transcriptional regulator